MREFDANPAPVLAHRTLSVGRHIGFAWAREKLKDSYSEIGGPIRNCCFACC
jgi:hypothetical protein